MALKATVYKAELNVSDLDRHYYASHALTLARHPSETDERLMVRLLAFALYADETLQFTRGLSSQDEPDLWARDLSGVIEHWIELGQPDEQRLRRACGRARRVTVITYSGRSADIWWEKSRAALARLNNLAVLNVPADVVTSLGALASRAMHWQALVQDGELQLISDDGTVNASIETRQQAQR